MASKKSKQSACFIVTLGGMKHRFNTNISAYEVQVAIDHSPWSDANRVSLPQVVASK